MYNAFFILSNVLMFTSLTIYIVRLVRGKTILSLATSVILFFTITLNTLTYLVVVRGNMKEALIGILLNLGSGFILSYAVFKKHYGKPRAVDYMTLLLAMAIGAFWRTTGNAHVTNGALQLIMLIGFVPNVYGLLADELRDHPAPWCFGVASYVFAALTVLNDPDGWRWTELMYPLTTGLIGNGTMAVASWTSRRRRAVAA